MNTRIVLTITTFAVAVNAPAAESTKYLNAVREFGENVLKYGRDTYGPKHTPLFVDGLNIHTHEPVKWISPKAEQPTPSSQLVFKAIGTEQWIISNFASQQTLLRTLDGLSAITKDPQYREAAIQAIKYAFENLMDHNGLFYWGDVVAYDALGDRVQGSATHNHALKVDYPYYELMWQVNPEGTKRYIEAYWSAHIFDWSNLDFNRTSGDRSTVVLEEPWNHEYKGGPVFFTSKSGGVGFFHSATSLAHAGTTLSLLSGQKEPLVWSKRLIQRFVNARHPNTGISPHKYNRPQRVFVGAGMEKHFSDPYVGVFPFYPCVHPFTEVRDLYYFEDVKPHQWLSIFLLGDVAGERGKEFTQWALEELTAWGKASYRPKDNVFMPILTDGTSIEGIVLEKSTVAPEGSTAKPLFVDTGYLWLYTTAYRITDDAFMWQMARDIARGNGFGDIGEIPGQTPALNRDTVNSDAYSLLAFLELYNKTKQQDFLFIARRIADNIVENRFHKGFFVSSKNHIYTKFDCFEPLALLCLVAEVESQSGLVPRVWPHSPVFNSPYRYRQQATDRHIIYPLTETSEPPLSLQEAAAVGKVDLVRTLIESGTYVDSIDDCWFKTALQRAVIAGHKDIAALLIDHGARVNYKDSAGFTSLRYAIEGGHTEIVELLIEKGADVSAKNTEGRTPLDIAVMKRQKDVAQLLVDKGAKLSSFLLSFRLASLLGQKDESDSTQEADQD
jgi:pectate lyase